MDTLTNPLNTPQPNPAAMPMGADRNTIPQPQPPLTYDIGTPASVHMKFDDGTEGDIPQHRVADATKDGGRVTTHMYFDDGTESWVPLDRVHDALKDGGTLGYRANAPKSAQPTGPSDAGVVSAVLGAETNPLKAGFDKGIAETGHTVGALAGKVMPNSWRDALGLPSSFNEPDYLQSSNGAETAGKVGESIAEFALGDEALKVLPLAKRLGIASKLESMASSSPYIAKILEHGVTAIRAGAVTVPQQMLHGATPTEALKTGAEAAALGAGTGAAIEGVSALAESPVGQAVKNIVRGGQPNIQEAIRTAGRTGADVAAARTTAAETAEAAGHVNVPDQYKAIVDEAMKSEPAWTPESAKPIAKALGKDFEIRGSVAEGKSTDNDLDIWQKKGDLTDAADTLKKQGFEYSHDTPHGEVWTNGTQHVDLWDAEHEPKVGHGADTEITEETPTKTPVKTTGVRTTIEDVSNDVKAKSQGLYHQLDNASGGRWQRYEDQIKNLEDKMDEVNGIDDDAYDRLETKRNDIETSQAQMIEDLKDKGINPRTADDAVAHYKQAMALRDLDKAVKASTAGDIRIGKAETVNPKVFTTRVQKLYDSGRLGQALGKDGATTLLKEAYAAKTARSVRNWTMAIAGLGAASAGFGHLFGVAKTAAEVAALP